MMVFGFVVDDQELFGKSVHKPLADFLRPNSIEEIMIIKKAMSLANINGKEITSIDQLGSVLTIRARDWQLVVRRGEEMLSLYLRL